MADSLIPFSDELEMEFKQMAFVLENVESACWIYVVYNQAVAREKIINRLQAEISLPFFVWDYSAEKPYPIDYLRDLTEEQQHNRAIISFFNTVDGGDKIIKSLDFNREKFAQYPHSLIFWVTENELGEMARKAGHFWAQRRGTFRFSKLLFENNQYIFGYGGWLNNTSGSSGWLNNLVAINNYQEALQQLDFYEHLLETYKSLSNLPTNTQRIVAESNDKISYLMYYLGRYKEASNFSQKALNIYLNILDKNNYSIIATYNNLALLYLYIGYYSEADLFLKKALIAVTENKLTLVMATILNNLGWLYREQCKYDEAEYVIQQSLSIRKKLLGEHHLEFAAGLYTLARLYNTQRKYSEAENMCRKNLEIVKNNLGENHHHVATSLNYLAGIYNALGKYQQAEEAYYKSLEIRKSILGVEHPRTKQAKADYEKFLIEKAARHKLNPL